MMVVAATQGVDQHVRSSLGFVLLKDTLTCGPGESIQRPSDNETLALPLSHSHPVYIYMFGLFGPRAWSFCDVLQGWYWIFKVKKRLNPADKYRIPKARCVLFLCAKKAVFKKWINQPHCCTGWPSWPFTHTTYSGSILHMHSRWHKYLCIKPQAKNSSPTLSNGCSTLRNDRGLLATERVNQTTRRERRAISSLLLDF